MKLNAALPALLAMTLMLVVATTSAAGGGPYGRPANSSYPNAKSCGSVETIVRKEVYRTLDADRSKGAALVRLFFHDCWVNGCDASVLLDQSAANHKPEKMAAANIGLRGFDVIEAIKAKVEAACPGAVSCADILAFAARDAASYLSAGRITYAVAPGRRDGVVSRAGDADATLPGPTFSFAQLERNFRRKNFDVEELVVLTGAHSIGAAHYPSFRERLAAPLDQIDARYQAALRSAAKDRSRATVANDIRDETDAFRKEAGYRLAAAAAGRRDFLNNTFYHNALDKRVLFKSDWALSTDAFALSKLKEYKEKPAEWDSDFAEALEKLSKLPAEGKHLEIRKKCSATNKPSYY